MAIRNISEVKGDLMRELKVVIAVKLGKQGIVAQKKGVSLTRVRFKIVLI